MPFSWDDFPYTNFHELNLDWFIKKFKEIFDEWSDLYTTLQNWKESTITELEEWKTGVETDMSEWEDTLTAALDEWKETTEEDISDWETGVLSNLNDWKDSFETLFNTTFSNLTDIKTDAEAARDRAEAAAISAETTASAISASSAQITKNANDISDLQKNLNDIYGSNAYNADEHGKTLIDISDTEEINEFVIHALGTWQGSGDPSTTNVRAIIDCKDITLYYSGEDISDYDNMTIHSIVSIHGELFDGDIYPAEGKTVVRKLCHTFDGTESWNVIGSGSKMLFRYNMGQEVTFSNDTNINFSSHFPCASITTSNTEIGWRGYNGNNTGYIQIRPGTDIATSETTWKAWLATQYQNGTPFQCVVELVTPFTAETITYSIPSELGINIYWTNKGNVSVKVMGGEFLWLKNAIHVIDFTALKGQTAINGNVSNSNALTTGVLNVENFEKIIVYGNNEYRYIIRSGNSIDNLNYLPINGLKGNFEFDVSNYKYIALNMYKYNKDTGDSINWDIDEWNRNVIILGCNTISEYKYDIPESFGIANVIRKAYQMCNIEYTTEGVLPFANGDVATGTNCKGVLYSSVWSLNQNFIPQMCSFHSFMTSVKDPNSYLYTQLGSLDERRPYYGTVCSTFAAYVLGMKGLVTTWYIDAVDGVEKLAIQDPQNLKIGDLLNRPREHSCIVTGILRDNHGLIIGAEICEAWKNFARRRWLPLSGGSSSSGDTANDLTQYFDNSHGFIAYRYTKINENTYTATPWVHIYHETETPIYSSKMCPKKGDKSVWNTSENVVIDLIDVSSTSGTLSDGTNTQTVSLSGNSINLGTLSAGSYTFTADGETVYFMVVNESHSVSADGHNLTITFSKNSATPINITVASTENHGVINFHVLTDAEIYAGSATIETTTGEKSIAVLYSTDYGWFYDEFDDITIS